MVLEIAIRDAKPFPLHRVVVRHDSANEHIAGSGNSREPGAKQPAGAALGHRNGHSTPSARVENHLGEIGAVFTIHIPSGGLTKFHHSGS